MWGIDDAEGTSPSAASCQAEGSSERRVGQGPGHHPRRCVQIPAPTAAPASRCPLLLTSRTALLSAPRHAPFLPDVNTQRVPATAPSQLLHPSSPGC